MRSSVPATMLVLLIVGTAADARATCSCMLRRMPPQDSTVGAGTGVDVDPSYSPTAAVFVTRQGTRTVLTMETAYTGPSVELSLVIPVPAPIAREQVRTVPGSLFRTLDRLTAPRVRHVWPACRRRRRRRAPRASLSSEGGGGGGHEPQMRLEEFGVEIEDEWAVDEYDVILLGADESTGLLGFLRDRGLLLPDIAAETLRAYIETGHRFILATVDPSRANRLGDKMMLSPIQIEYESEELRIPVRLGTLNSPGEQELLIYVLSTEGRYELANRPNVTAPSDLRIRSGVRGGIAELYGSLTNETFRRTPGAAITEFAHVLGRRVGRRHVRRLGLPQPDRSNRRTRRPRTRETWTVTRIRHRYGIDLDDDLTLRPAAEPLRLTRRWRTPALRVWGRRGESAFHVQYVVQHGGSRCPNSATQRRYARRWATAESMWEASNDLWPGEAILDPIEALGIEPGSSAPSGWPPPPPEIQPPPIARQDGPMDPLAPRDGEPTPTASAEEPGETAAAPAAAIGEEGSGWCAASPPGRAPLTLLVCLGLALFLSRRR